MPRVCRVCTDHRRELIDGEIAASKSIPSIAWETGLPESNLYRHKKDHTTPTRLIESRPAATHATVERLELLDAQLAEVQAMAVRRGHTQAAVAALNHRIRIVTEISTLVDAVAPKEKRIVHVHLDAEQAERIAMSYVKHQQLTGKVIDGKG